MYLRSLHLACKSCKTTGQSQSSRVEQVNKSMWHSSGESLKEKTGYIIKKEIPTLPNYYLVAYQFFWCPCLSFPAATLATKTVSTTRHLRCCVMLRSRAMGGMRVSERIYEQHINGQHVAQHVLQLIRYAH